MTPEERRKTHEDHKQLRRSNPSLAQQKERENRGLGKEWSEINGQIGLCAYLVDPDKGRCVLDNSNRPIYVQGSGQPYVSGMTLPSRDPGGKRTQQLWIDSDSLARKLNHPNPGSFFNKTRPLFVNGRLMEAQGTCPLTLTVEQAIEGRILSPNRVTAPVSWFSYAGAAVFPVLDRFANIFDGILRAVQVLQISADKTRRQALLEFPRKILRTPASHLGPRSLTDVIRLSSKGRQQAIRLMTALRHHKPPVDAVKVEEMKDRFAYSFEAAEGWARKS